jgi:hypothetical protein
VPSVAVGATPAGWRPVDYQDLQISVPASWAVITGGEGACGDATGVVILGQGTWCSPNQGETAAPGTSIVTVTGSKSPLMTKRPPALVVNGLSVYAPDITPVYVIPALGTELTFSGPFESRLLQSITYSPRAVALQAGRASTLRTPRRWQSVAFKGITVAVPSAWRVTRSAHAPACGTDVEVSQPGLTLASGPELPVSCPAPPLTAPAQVAGVELDGFPAVEAVGTLPSPSCLLPRRINGLEVCIDAQPSFGELILEAFTSRTRSVTVKIGMFGSGRTGRRILESLHRS